MRIFKNHPFLRLVNSYLIDSPQPTNISYLWNFGSLLAVCLIIQIITGVTLAMHYNPSIAEAFNSVEHITRDVFNGAILRYFHANGASMFFILVYIHIARGLFYGSYRSPRALLWCLGVIIFILMMAALLWPNWVLAILVFIIWSTVVLSLLTKFMLRIFLFILLKFQISRYFRPSLTTMKLWIHTIIGLLGNWKTNSKCQRFHLSCFCIFWTLRIAIKVTSLN